MMPLSTRGGAELLKKVYSSGKLGSAWRLRKGQMLTMNGGVVLLEELVDVDHESVNFRPKITAGG